MKSRGKWYKIGPGVAEIRIWDAAGAFRAAYVARFADAVHVLQCFGKKTRKTGRTDLKLAAKRYGDPMKELSR